MTVVTTEASKVAVGMELQIGDAVGIVDEQRPSRHDRVRIVLCSGNTRRTYCLMPDEPVYVREEEQEVDENESAWEKIRRVKRSWSSR